MEARNVFPWLVAGILAIACVALARGAMAEAEEARRETARCEARNWKRVLDLPRITVGREIRFRGKPVIAVRDIPHDDVVITELRRVLADERDTACDPSKLCLDNVIVIETWDAVDSILVTRITTTAWVVGYDVILAAPRRPGTW